MNYVLFVIGQRSLSRYFQRCSTITNCFVLKGLVESQVQECQNEPSSRMLTGECKGSEIIRVKVGTKILCVNQNFLLISSNTPTL